MMMMMTMILMLPLMMMMMMIIMMMMTMMIKSKDQGSEWRPRDLEARAPLMMSKLRMRMMRLMRIMRIMRMRMMMTIIVTMTIIMTEAMVVWMNQERTIRRIKRGLWLSHMFWKELIIIIISPVVNGVDE